MYCSFASVKGKKIVRLQNESIMRHISNILLSCLLLLPAGMEAQNEEVPQQWTLRNCIDYALENNITIRRNRISVKSADEDVKTAKADFLPSVSGSISQRIVNRPNSTSGTIISGDNITTSESKTSYNGSYGIDASWTLYNGGSRRNTLKQQTLNSRIAELAVSESENSIEEQITQLYVQILYSADAVKVNESTLEVSKAQFERGKEMFNVGSIASSDLAQLEAQVSSDNYSLVTAQTTLQNYKLQLKQLLELDGDFELDLYIPELDDSNVLIPLPAKDDVYNAALGLRPEIQSGKLSIEAADLDIKVARAGYIPTLSLSAGIGSTNANGTDYSFSEQIKQNWNNSLGLTVSIPIFDKRQTKSAINKAKFQKQTSELDLLDEQKTLYQTIENLWLNANSAQQQYVASVANQKSTQTSYDLVSEQFNVGLKNTVELLTEKNNLLSAQQETLQAKYTAILNACLLRFYQGEEIDLY